VACPPGADVYRALGAVGLVYQRTDRFEAFPGTDRAQIQGYHDHLRTNADVTVFCASLLYDDEASTCTHAVYIDHGVDYDRFADAGEDPTSHPADIPVPDGNRVGFVGGIDDHTFDPPFFVDVATRLPDVQFILVGACSLPEDWCPLPNVHLLGQRPYDEVPGYMAACDVLIMPWNRSDWIRACNPIKLKEYLAVGRPIVTTDFYELRNYQGYVRIETEPEDFARAIRESLEQGADRAHLRARVEDRTWEAQSNRMIEELERVGLTLESGSPRPTARPEVRNAI
ncbi:MAG: glycosyltransferase, partial [Phycisphaerales bacterium]|nr:glycosyltransferase [Phycisphaerales bacterium]